MNKKALALALLLSGCASGGPEPDWLDGTSERYPPERFLAGQGQGENAAIARDRARAELVKVFEVRILEQSDDRSQAERASSEGETKATSSSSAARRVQTEADHVVEGMSIADVWRDPEGAYFALAVLDRLQAAQRLREKVEALDALTEREIARARTDADALNRVAAAYGAATAQTEREVAQRYLRVVDPTGLGIPTRFDAVRLGKDAAELASRLRFAAEAEADPVGNLRSLMQGAIGHAGFRSAPAQDADYRLRGVLAVEESTADGWQWAHGVLELSLLDRNGEVRTSQRFTVKASAQQRSVARHRLMGEIDRLLRARLRETVLGFTSGQTGGRRSP